MMFQGCKEDVLAPCEALLMGWRPENKEKMPSIGDKIFSVLEAQIPESGWVNGLPVCHPPAAHARVPVDPACN